MNPGGEPLDPAVDGDVVDGDAALGQQFLNVAVGQAIAQIPAHRHGDHLPRKRKPANTEDEPEDVIAPASRPRRSANATLPFDLAERHRRAAGSAVMEWEYLLLTARKRS